MSKIRIIWQKIKRRGSREIVDYFKTKSWYFKIYPSFWHYKFSDSNNLNSCKNNYFTAIPNHGAGIGHQISNWIAGYWFARQFGLKYAHASFSNKKWEDFLGFGLKEVSVNDLVTKGYKKIRLPLFDEYNEAEVNLIKKIIESYRNSRVVFMAEQDQFYRDQFGVMDDLKKKFYNAPSRKNNQLIYSNSHFNIAIHIRRGDIVVGQENKNSNLLMRWQDNQYFVKVLTQVVQNVKTDKPIAIYLFSQGDQVDFAEFLEFPNCKFCLDMNAQNSFLHMIYADLLITSKSSFSYKPALLNNGIKVCPKLFWHGYPENKNWILVGENGEINNF